ncbi:hypothetical protein TARUN_5393 [Trichoderma arundinaceum]|uniref:Uncharacterized protein n=1 Tax=Trichoderma arundinaceum TaxID=490622 RepID=A0A395NLT7_TRIAR|nr:hypothetical protein TARUN_5393 [Trichoderma arundinaceum]
MLCANLATAEENEGAFKPTEAGCTSTMTVTLSRLPTPPYWPQCSWDGTMSIYAATVTLNRPVDCDGCTDVRVTAVPQVHCPAKIISTTVHVRTPTTVYRTICSATPTPRL